jgi:hypothetical protein
MRAFEGGGLAVGTHEGWDGISKVGLSMDLNPVFI